MRAPVLLGSVAACIALAVSGCGGSSHTSTGANPSSGTPTASASSSAPRTNLQSVFEDEDLLDAGVPRAFSTFTSLGVQTLRVFVPWANLAPDPSASHVPHVSLTSMGSYSAPFWAFYDSIVQAGQADHIRILFDLGAPAPAWALGPHRQTSLYEGDWKPNAAEFEDFVKVIGERYSGTYRPAGAAKALPRVSDWSVWNEPNGHFLTPNAVGSIPYSPRLYRGLVDAEWSGLAASGHTPQRDTILIGETAPRGVPNPGNSSGLYPLPFIRDLYCVSSGYRPLTGSAATALGCPSSGSVSAFKAANPGLFELSGWADHPYSDTTSPTQVSPNASEDSDYASLGYLESTLDGVLGAYDNHRQVPIYSTEYGYKTNPPTDLGISDQLAAAYMNETEYLSWRNPRVRSYSQYLLVDPTDPQVDDFDTGLEKPGSTPATAITDATPKPAVYDAYRMPLWVPVTSASKGQKLQVWGCVRPVNQARPIGPVKIQFATSGSFRTLKSVTLDPTRSGCYFDTTTSFPASGTVRLSYGDIVSRTQAITVH